MYRTTVKERFFVMHFKITHLLFSLPLLFSPNSFAAEANNLGVKNFRQIIASFHGSTGLSIHDAQLTAVKRSVMSRLPTNGTIEEISSTSIIALYELAGGFCKRMIDVDAERIPAQRRAHTKVAFQTGP